MKSCFTCADKEYLADIKHDGPCKFCGPKMRNWREETPAPKGEIQREIDIFLFCVSRIDDPAVRAEVASSFLNVFEALETSAKAGRLSLV